MKYKGLVYLASVWQQTEVFSAVTAVFPCLTPSLAGLVILKFADLVLVAPWAYVYLSGIKTVEVML